MIRAHHALENHHRSSVREREIFSAAHTRFCFVALPAENLALCRIEIPAPCVVGLGLSHPCTGGVHHVEPNERLAAIPNSWLEKPTVNARVWFLSVQTLIDMIIISLI